MQPVPGLTANMPPPQPGMQPQMPPGGGGMMPPPGAMPPGPGGAPGTQPPPPGGQPQPMPGAPAGAMPPTAPMSDAPPPPLPINPRPAQPSPKTSGQAMQEANLLGLQEQKNMPGMATEELNDQAMAMGRWASLSPGTSSPLPPPLSKIGMVPGGAGMQPVPGLTANMPPPPPGMPQQMPPAVH